MTKLVGFCGVTLLLLICGSTPAGAQNCPAANPNDWTPDHEQIQACLDAGTQVVLTPGNPGYIIADKIRFRADDRLFTSVGGKARLLADPNLDGPLLQVQDANDYEISEIIFDGNKNNRTKTSLCFNTAFAGEHGSNFFVSGFGYRVHHVDTINAMCGSGAEVSGNDFDLYSILAADNGTEATAGGPFADGITLQRCDGGHLHDSWIEENSDVGLMFFRGVNCLVDNNRIRQLNRRVFSAFSIGSDKDNSDFSGTVVENNTVEVGFDRSPTGINVGPHIANPSVVVTNAGTIRNNTISGAVVNLLIDGIQAGSIVNNTMSNHQGSYLLPCGSSADFTAGHFGSATLSGGWTCWVYDGCGCATEP
jgi:hypothetical protein